MISKANVRLWSARAVFVVIFFKTMYDKTITVDWGFVIFRRNNQGLSKCYKGYGSADNTYLDLDYSGSYKLTQ